MARWTKVFAEFPVPQLLMEQNLQVDGWSFSDQPMMDWNYYMRREMQEVLPGLYLGPYAAANKSKLSSLLENGITHIVCIRQDADASFVRPNFEDHFKYLVLNIADSPIENIIQYIPKVCVFLDTCFQSGGKALIHGNIGISRSAALTIGYVMQKRNLSYKDAMQLVQQRRFCISPNEGFVQQLREYESIYQASRMVDGGHQSSKTHSSKRKFTEEED